MSDEIIDIRSQHTVAQTIDRLEGRVRGVGLLVFARIDFAGDAERAGLTMSPMQALLFGNPRAGTPILVAAPRAGLELPLRALAWEDADATVWLSLTSPDEIARRYGLSAALMAPLTGARALIEWAAGSAG